MAHFCFMVFGSRGDVQPMVAVAAQLVKMGHRATLCTGGRFKKMIEDQGIIFQETALDLMELADSSEGKRVFQAPMRNMSLARRLLIYYILPRFRTSLSQCYEAAKDADIIIYHPKVFGAVDMAEQLGIPCVVMPAVPIIYPVKEFPNLGLTTRSLGHWLNRLSYKVNNWAEGSYIQEVNNFRKTDLQLPSRKAGVYARFRRGKEIPILYPFSKLLFETVQSWKGHVELSGFCFLQQEEKLNNITEDFLKESEKPVLVTFGSVEIPQLSDVFHKLCAALEKTNNRAICIGRMERYLGGKQPTEFVKSNVLFMQEAPYFSLFPRVKGVMFHGGIGTGSTALQCGVPLIPIPISADQPFWAKRYEQIGCSTATIHIKHNSEADYVRAIDELQDPQLLHNVERMAGLLQKESGTYNAANYLIHIVN